MAAFTEMLGEKLLLKKDTPVPTKDALEGKVVLLYFSAHWCPPCRGFTPRLAELYTALKAAKKNVECVFLSSDREQASFEEYFAEMPWLALPYSERSIKEKLSKQYKVRGIPSLVVLDSDGSLITKDGRASASKEDAVDTFPWKPPSLAELLSTPLEGPGGAARPSAADLAKGGAHIALYFSAHWCPPCKRFTPRLAATYKAALAAGHSFEVVFVSSDKTQEQCDAYFAEMPWARLPYAERGLKEKLSEHFGVEGIPTLIMLAPDLSVINADARGPVDNDEKAANFPWVPPPYCDLEDGCEALNEEPCLVALMEGCDDADAEAAEKCVAAVAKENTPPGGAKLHYFIAKQEGGIAPQLRKICKRSKPGDDAELVLLDLAGSRSFFTPKDAAAPLTEARLQDFVAAWRAGSLEPQPCDL